MDQLLQHFGNMTANGREINVKIKKWQNWQDNLETEFEKSQGVFGKGVISVAKSVIEKFSGGSIKSDVFSSLK
jgi:hypothetical protein